MSHRRHNLTINLGIFFLLVMGGMAAWSLPSVPNLIRVDQPAVHLKDIFPDLPAAISKAHGDTIILSTPQDGSKKKLTRKQLKYLSKKYEIPWEAPLDLHHVWIQRTGKSLSKKDLEAKLHKLMDMEESAQLSLSGNLNIFLPKTASLILKDLDHLGQHGRFKATIILQDGTHQQAHALFGRIIHMMEAPILKSPLPGGSMIQKNDLTWQKFPAHKIRNTHISNLDDLIGKKTKRPLRANTLIRQADVGRPLVVKKGSIMPVKYTAKNIKLTLKARALSDGYIGDTIPFEGYDKKRRIFATIIDSHSAQVNTP